MIPWQHHLLSTFPGMNERGRYDAELLMYCEQVGVKFLQEIFLLYVMLPLEPVTQIETFHDY